jgi:cellulose synthase (UDP-forming)
MVPLRASFRWRRIPASTPARLRVTLNGVLVARRSYRGPKAGETVQETLQVPVTALYPRNTLTFELEYPELPASVRPEFEIDMDSALDLRDVAHFTEMPRLDLFAKAGFPFTRHADLAETAIALSPNAAPAQISLALNALAFLAGQTGHPATWVTFLSTSEIERTTGKDVLMIGTPQDQTDLPARSAALPLVYSDGVFRTVDPRQLLHRYFSIPWAGYGKERRRANEFVGREGALQSVLQGARLGPNRSLVQLIALNDDETGQILPALETAAAEDNIFGNLSVQRAGAYQSFRLADESYAAGRLGPLQAFDHWMTRYLLFMPLFILLCAVPLAPLIEAYVERRRKARLDYDEELTV